MGAATSPPAVPDAPRAGWGDLARLLSPVRRALVVAVVLQGIAAAASIVPFICVAEIAGHLLDSDPPDRGAITRLVILAVVAFSVRLVAQGVAGQVTHLADNRLQLSIRRRVADRLGRVPLGWFGARHSGEVKRAVQDDVAAMHHLVAHSLPDLAAGVVAPVLSLIYLALIDWRLALITLIPILLFLALYSTIVRGYAEQMAGHARALGRLNAAVVEFVQGIAVVKAFGASERGHGRYAEAADHFADHHHRWVAPIARRSALGELLCSAPVMLAVVLAGGAGLVRWGGMDPADVVPFALLGLGLSAPLLIMGFSAQGFRLAAEASRRVADLLATPELPVVAPDEALRPEGAGVELEGVGFSYDGVHPVLEGVSVRLEPGTVTAVVGASGAGKSTLAELVPRFWDADHGAVRLGGADVRRVLPEDLYGRVAFVFQDPGLMRISLADNIRLGAPEADDERLHRAARAAQIHERILELPRGYDSVVGEDARLSGGESQRVAIARALLADRPILVLDEATAFADPESEAAIQDALSRLAAGRTLLVIAHRLSTVVGADRILVLDRGRVVEEGRHDELLARDGEYARLWRAHRRVVA